MNRAAEPCQQKAESREDSEQQLLAAGRSAGSTRSDNLLPLSARHWQPHYGSTASLGASVFARDVQAAMIGIG